MIVSSYVALAVRMYAYTWTRERHARCGHAQVRSIISFNEYRGVLRRSLVHNANEFMGIYHMHKVPIGARTICPLFTLPSQLSARFGRR